MDLTDSAALEATTLATVAATVAPTGVTLSSEDFEQLYAAQEDPWHADTSWYEQRKHRLTIAALPRKRYHRAVEPGCSTGALTALLAERCDEVFAFDFVERAVEAAQARVGDLEHVHVVNARFPEYWPYGGGDLVVWSEVAYYLSDVGWDVATSGLDRWLEPGGHVVAVHSTGDNTGDTGHPRPGTCVGTCIGRQLDQLAFLERLVGLVDEHFELGVWVRRPPELLV